MRQLVCFSLTLFLFSTASMAGTTCEFDHDGTTLLTLLGDCTTDVTLFIPHGYTLDGKERTITAVDPEGGHFVGAVVMNEGTVANVRHLRVTVSDLANVCDSGAFRLRGIMFEGASGSITHCTVTGINQGPSGCQEGNAIEVRNAPFDGTQRNTQTVQISHNTITDYQKTGIVANGDVDVTVEHNLIGASATQENLAANSVQLGFGAFGSVVQNLVDGNQWMGTSAYAATALLLFDPGPVNVSMNNIRGNSDVGIFLVADDATSINNRVFDAGPDHDNSGYDRGVWSSGLNNIVENNKVRGFDIPYDGVDNTGKKNKVIPGPNGFTP